jgi:hypothetical protein
MIREDAFEGPTAFAQKRKPQWRDRWRLPWAEPAAAIRRRLAERVRSR